MLGEPAFRIKGSKDGVIFETGLKPVLESILDGLEPEMFAAHEKYNCLLTVLRRSGLPLLHEICVYAPTWRALDAFMPTWDRMLESIKPVGK